MSKKHQKMFSWWLEGDTEDWLSPEKGEAGGFDMELDYIEYQDGRANKFGNFGLSGISVARKSTPFGKKGEFEAFVDSIPNLKDNDLPILENYTKKTEEDTVVALERWKERIGDKISKASNARTAEVDTSYEDEDMDDGNDEVPEPDSNKAKIASKLAKFGIK